MKKFLWNNDGVSLTELLVAIPVVVLLLSGIISFLSSSVNSYQMYTNKMAAQQIARCAVDNMVREIHSAKPGSIKLTTNENIEFVTTRYGINQTIVYSLVTTNGIGQLMRKEDAGSPESITSGPITSISISSVVFSPVNTSNTPDNTTLPYPPNPTYPLILTNNIVSIKLIAEGIQYKTHPTYTIETTVAAIH